MILRINGETVSVEAAGTESLLRLLRDELGLYGAKDACEQGECGSCTVLMDGLPVCSCLVMAADAAGSEIITIEGITSDGALHPVQQALLETGGAQCGYCTPGIVMSAANLLEHNPHPSEADVREALAGNLCRCTGYGSIIRAVMGTQ